MMLLSQVGRVAFVLCALGLAPWLADAQGTLQYRVAFEGPPPIPPTSDGAPSYYYERGMEFRPIGAGQFGRSGGAQPGFAQNGTAYLFAMLGDSLSATRLNGQRFGLVSVDLAEFSILYQTPLTVPFIGYRPDGSTVRTEFVTDGIIDSSGPLTDFQTFYFDARFRDLVRVEIPTYGWSLDNLVFSQVPEPAAGALLLVGGFLLWAMRGSFTIRRSAGTRLPDVDNVKPR